MSAPTFNSEYLFSYTDSNGDYITEGTLMVPDYSKTIQTLHFNGENGNRYLDMGYGDQRWYYKGYLWANTLGDLANNFKAIQSYIDNDPGDYDSYKVLVDTFGNTFSKALILKCTKQMQHMSDDGYLAEVVVEGIVCGNVQDTGGGS